MIYLAWLALGALGGWLYGKRRETAMGPLGDSLLGIGGGLAGGVIFFALGLGWPPLTLLGAALGGAAMVAMIGKLKG
jgi:uncharacterized membrane protein YeaQ/YmgE (transglycosylase-associated protein family)